MRLKGVSKVQVLDRDDPCLQEKLGVDFFLQNIEKRFGGDLEDLDNFWPPRSFSDATKTLDDDYLLRNGIIPFTFIENQFLAFESNLAALEGSNSLEDAERVGYCPKSLSENCIGLGITETSTKLSLLDMVKRGRRVVNRRSRGRSPDGGGTINIDRRSRVSLGSRNQPKNRNRQFRHSRRFLKQRSSKRITVGITKPNKPNSGAIWRSVTPKASNRAKNDEIKFDGFSAKKSRFETNQNNISLEKKPIAHPKQPKLVREKQDNWKIDKRAHNRNYQFKAKKGTQRMRMGVVCYSKHPKRPKLGPSKKVAFDFKNSTDSLGRLESQYELLAGNLEVGGSPMGKNMDGQQGRKREKGLKSKNFGFFMKFISCCTER